MPIIAYDPSRESLFKPYIRETVFNKHETTISAYVCAELSRLAYLPFETDILNGTTFLDRLKSDLDKGGLKYEYHFDIAATGTQGFVASLGEQLVLAFRGSEPDLGDISTDLNSWQAGFGTVAGTQVHAGFKTAFESVWPLLHVKFGDRLNTAIYTGHSLGAALATLAAYTANNHVPHSLPKLIAFGSPAVGNKVFAEHLNNILAEQYVNCCDIISRLPPASLGFAQVGIRKYINENGQLGVISTPSAEKTDQSAARYDYFLNQAWRIGTVIVRDLADHAPINYIRALPHM
jgi:Lipase (class 3)